MPVVEQRPAALVAEDDVLIRMAATDMLDSFGFRTLEAEDGDGAMIVLEEQNDEVALLFSDVDMPGSRDGFTLAREVAARWPAISIVIASGRLAPRPGDMPEGARFVAKPFTAEMVREHLLEVLPEHRQPDE